MPDNSFLELGALGIILAFAIKEFFSYLKARKEPSDKNGFNQAILSELQTMNNNHLHALQEAIEAGNRQLVETIHSDNTRMIELLGEIKGNLNARK